MRAYIRLDPGFDERKESYPDGGYRALVACICLAEQQPERGRFRSERFLRALLGRVGRHVTYLLKQGDLTIQEDGRLYLVGWDEWQEGDWKVGERVGRIRARRNGASNGPRNGPGNAQANGASYGAGNGPPSALRDIPSKRNVSLSGGAGRSAGKQATETPRQQRRASAGMPDVRLTAEQLDAWRSFGHEWDDFKRAWLSRGFLWPPSGDSGDDDTSQRGLLWQVLDARPADLPEWVAAAPAGTTRQVLASVLDHWHEIRAEAGDDEPDAPTAPSERQRDAEALGSILSRLPLHLEASA